MHHFASKKYGLAGLAAVVVGVCVIARVSSQGTYGDTPAQALPHAAERAAGETALLRPISNVSPRAAPARAAQAPPVEAPKHSAASQTSAPTEGMLFARDRLAGLEQLREDCIDAPPRAAAYRIHALLEVSLAVLLDEFGEYQTGSPMRKHNEFGEPLRFIVNGRGYYFPHGRFPELDELQGMLEHDTEADPIVPQALQDQVALRYEEAAAYLTARAEG